MDHTQNINVSGYILPHKSVLNFLYSNLPVVLCFVFLCPCTSKEGQNIEFYCTISLHPTSCMFRLKNLKRQNSMCKPEDYGSCKCSPGPGIYFNAFIHVYSPWVGADNPLGTNVDVNRKPLSLCLVASFKTISLKYDFKHILNDFIHVYSPRAMTDNPLGTKFWFQQKFVIILPICWQFKFFFLEVWFFTVFFMFFSHVYSPRQGQTTHWGQKFYDNRKAFSLCPYVASFKMTWFYTHF